MDGEDVSGLSEFEERLREVRKMVGDRASLLFRGQGDSSWPLTTTLERAGCEGMSLNDHYLLFTRVKPAVETFTGVNLGCSGVGTMDTAPTVSPPTAKTKTNTHP